ncbi:hypothetical protein [Paenibacillus sp. MMS18-CY102]|uniref:hypothetical protein n=1 Tax=Paenibacillus sp. MMS18-CY102 TaxID=2682849 RepID=UPI0013662395|nr:hypothetical protein [Paenibacillus sp. MMS18-CY102]MWC27156.1 hypothetical protein [Paenibacillus sp. MMS18-CY102]
MSLYKLQWHDYRRSVRGALPLQHCSGRMITVGAAANLHNKRKHCRPRHWNMWLVPNLMAGDAI